MADKKISELTALTTPDGAEELVVNDGGTSKKITIDNIFNQDIDVTGTVTADGVSLGDNQKAQFGADNDLQIYHNGSNSYIKDSGAGYLILGNSDVGTAIQDADNNNLLLTSANDIKLGYNGGFKLATTSTGIDVTGTVTADGLTGDVTGDLTGESTLPAISTDITDTAVDVFVYDTRKDSDGGAWRKRTQHTSWYNETLNTSTRGSRKEFPAVAVIVAESNQVTIYDGDDPSMPMWMVFDHGTRNFLPNYISAGDITSVIAINGDIYAGDTSNGIIFIRFFSDAAGFYGEAYKVDWNRPIVDRNANTTTETLDLSVNIVNRAVNDVAMTVLPNAPIDDATGLPVPTIAVATDGGVSVIKDDGTVVDISGQDTYKVKFTDTGLWATFGSYRTPREGNIPNVDITYANFTVNAWNTASIPPVSHSYPTSITDTVVGSGYGLNVLSADREMVSNITSSYNTGWMNGDIKLATLSDTDDTDVTGSELVTNGDFSSGTTGWTANSGGSAGGVPSLNVNASGQLEILSQVDDYGGANQLVSLVYGKTYVLTIDVISCNKSSQIRIGYEIGVTSGSPQNIATSGDIGVGSHSLTFTVTENHDQYYLYIGGRNDVTSLVVDNISVRLAEEDRSVNGNGLQVFGTVTKSAVSSGADLVGYSGFSSSNYLFQPINAMGIDWSTEWSLMFWSLDQGFCVSLEDQNTSSYNNTVLLLYNDASNFVTRSHNANYHVPLSGGIDGLHHIAAVYKDGRIIIYQDGVSIYDNTSNGISNLDVGLMVGARTYNGFAPYAPANQKLALLKVSGTNPSPEQIKKIYEDEKVLFQEGAQATLYGSSDAVTALAYDDDTNLLHVGTSAGRSDFQGLRRVDNTTTAVGAAISASNGLIAED